MLLPPESLSQPIADWWDAFSFWFTTVGVVLTFVGGAASIEARRWVRRVARDKKAIVAARGVPTQIEIESAKRETSEADWWDSFTFWFTTIGVILTFVGGAASIEARRYARLVTADKDKYIETVKGAAAQANARASEANARALEAQARAAALIKGAEDERLARIKIQEHLAPRNINDQDKKTIEAALRPFANQKVVVDFESFNSEAASLAGQIATALTAAHWEVYQNKAQPLGQDKWIPGLNGIFVKSGSVTEAGKALAAALTRARLVTTGPTTIGWLSEVGDPILVIVGPKP
jgi:hypothetical protein